MSTGYLTFDVDWAPDFVLRDVVSLLDRSHASATFFCTHRSPFISELASHPRIELGIHPNFFPGSSQGGTEAEVWDFFSLNFPDAVSMRTHGLFAHGRLLVEARRRGVLVDSSLFLVDGAPAAQTMPTPHGDLRRMPFRYGDDAWVEGWGPVALPGPGVSMFHPIHVHLNSASPAEYASLKKSVPNLSAALPGQTDPHVNRSRPGVRDQLETLLTSGQRWGKMRELAAA